MSTIKRIYLGALLIFLSLNISAQQSPLGNSYLLNPYLINPAEAGRNEVIDVFLTHREQWVGVQDAPVTNFITTSVPFLNNMAVGVNLQYDRAHIYNNMVANATYSYKFQIAEEHKLSLGLNLGFIQSSFRTDKAILEDQTDVIAQRNLSGTAFNSDFGLKYIWDNSKDKIDVGISITQLPAERIKVDYQESGTGYYSMVRQYYAYSKYYRDLNEDWRIEPSLMVRFNPESKTQFDISGLAWWRNLVWAGLSYRSGSSMFASVGANLMDQIQVSYSYEFGVSGVSSASNGSHEITLGYVFKGGRSKDNIPDSLKDKFYADTVFVIDTLIRTDTVMIDSSGIARDTIIGQFDTLSKLREDSLNDPEMMYPDVPISKASDKDVKHLAENERVVKENFNGTEAIFVMEVGYYIVYGSYISKMRAFKEAKRYRDMGYEAKVYEDEDNLWYRIALGTFKDKNSSKDFLFELKEEGFSKVWYLEVE